jgi:hypothetical protein
MNEKGKSLKSLLLDTGKSQIVENCTLYQNAPNPISEQTTIRYYINEKFQAAKLYIYDLQGVQLSYININNRGQGSISISAYDFKPGIYLYSLIVYNIEVSTKKMILTE